MAGLIFFLHDSLLERATAVNATHMLFFLQGPGFYETWGVALTSILLRLSSIRKTYWRGGRVEKECRIMRVIRRADTAIFGRSNVFGWLRPWEDWTGNKWLRDP